MNKMKEYYTAIWNPLDGCLHNCCACLARAEAEQCGHRSFASYMAQDEPIDTDMLRILDFPMRDEATGKTEPFPFKFSPTYYRHRLSELPSQTKPENILVCGKGDLLGSWVDDWIVQEVFGYIESADWHNYLFISKNPARYDTLAKKTSNMLFGAAIDSEEQADAIIASKLKSLDFLSINPIYTDINLGKFLNETSSKIRWVIVGAQCGGADRDIYPEREWLASISDICTSNDILLFFDENLSGLMGDTFRQEYPLLLQKTFVHNRNALRKESRHGNQDRVV